MFTGIVEEVGRVSALNLKDPLQSLWIRATRVLQETSVGDSVAINGVCLTVTEIGMGEFSVGVMEETLRRTSMAQLTPGDEVNLERALRADGRLGGHIVQGHVDGVGEIQSVTPDGHARGISIRAQPQVLRYVVEKGFVAVDGASLTVTSVDENSFSIAIIPYTQEHVSRSMQTAGKQVNIEVDILAKYVEKLVIH